MPGWLIVPLSKCVSRHTTRHNAAPSCLRDTVCSTTDSPPSTIASRSVGGQYGGQGVGVSNNRATHRDRQCGQRSGRPLPSAFGRPTRASFCSPKPRSGERRDDRVSVQYVMDSYNFFHYAPGQCIILLFVAAEHCSVSKVPLDSCREEVWCHWELVMVRVDVVGPAGLELPRYQSSLQRRLALG